MYEGQIRVTYLDKPHAYYAQNRVAFELPETDEKAWGPKWRPKGTTSVLGDTLEKKGLMTWPLGLALTELFGFYDFEPEPGNRLTGFSKGKGTIWPALEHSYEFLPLVVSASKAWQRKQKTGADIGSLVHEAIEHFVTGVPYELTLAGYEAAQEFPDADTHAQWLLTAPVEFKMAEIAFERFTEWWEGTKPTLINAEEIVYSKEFDIAGAYDALIEIDGKIIMEDHKTSKASVSAGAPQGVYYSYFIQSAAYAAMLLEMGAIERIDDLMIVSCRKDGQFNTVRASEVGLSVPDAINWWRAVVVCNRNMNNVKKQLIRLGNQSNGS